MLNLIISLHVLLSDNSEYFQFYLSEINFEYAAYQISRTERVLYCLYKNYSLFSEDDKYSDREFEECIN